MTLLQPRCNLPATSLLKPQPFLLATLQRIHRFFRRDFLHCLDISTNACLEALHLSAELAMETANGTVQRTLTRFFRFSRILYSWNILQVIPVIPGPCSSGSIWRAVLVAQGESCKTRKHSASQLPSGVPLSKTSKSPISQHKSAYHSVIKFIQGPRGHRAVLASLSSAGILCCITVVLVSVRC